MVHQENAPAKRFQRSERGGITRKTHTTGRKSNLCLVLGFGKRRSSRKSFKIRNGEILQALESLFDNYAENYFRRKYRLVFFDNQL